MTNIPQQTVFFTEIFSKPISVNFSRELLSSNGGSLLLKAVDKKLGLTEAIAETINENSVAGTQLMLMAESLAEIVLRRQARRRKGKHRQRVILDIDPTCDPTYGNQQLTFFNGHYDTWCYLPLVMTISFGRERRKYPFALVLRPGIIHSKKGTGTLSVLKRVIPLIRKFFPKSPIFFRADAEFAKPWLLDWLEGEDVNYAISIASNAVLKRHAARAMDISRFRACKFNRSETWHRETQYQAGTWKNQRRVAYKAEVLLKDGEFRDNDRYIVTNLKDNYGPQGIFNFYYGHSIIENTIKDFKHDLALGRTSCTSFRANQLRVMWSLAAFILMQSLQEQIAHKRLAAATMHTLRECLLKIAVVVRESTRRIVANFTAHHPWGDIWLQCALKVGAAPG